MDTGSGNADWADGAHGFVHLSLPRGGERESWAGVSMLKGRRARVVGNGSNWEAGGCVRILSASTGKEDEESVYCACNHA